MLKFGVLAVLSALPLLFAYFVYLEMRRFDQARTPYQLQTAGNWVAIHTIFALVFLTVAVIAWGYA